ncbi:hypothetical protein L596_000743 [Steinernema carpocapsae]|uniref:Uncharacterized protein n=1 Tax=Steinernema carpocapsae TaxID=34508 RepID=A0A4U8ULG2_STECR|nr:hypothetical protein L596_000743 [Steinernema carpocapsae]
MFEVLRKASQVGFAVYSLANPLKRLFRARDVFNRFCDFELLLGYCVAVETIDEIIISCHRSCIIFNIFRLISSHSVFVLPCLQFLKQKGPPDRPAFRNERLWVQKAIESVARHYSALERARLLLKIGSHSAFSGSESLLASIAKLTRVK